MTYQREDGPDAPEHVVLSPGREAWGGQPPPPALDGGYTPEDLFESIEWARERHIRPSVGSVSASGDTLFTDVDIETVNDDWVQSLGGWGTEGVVKVTDRYRDRTWERTVREAAAWVYRQRDGTFVPKTYKPGDVIPWGEEGLPAVWGNERDYILPQLTSKDIDALDAQHLLPTVPGVLEGGSDSYKRLQDEMTVAAQERHDALIKARRVKRGLPATPPREKGRVMTTEDLGIR